MNRRIHFIILTTLLSTSCNFFSSDEYNLIVKFNNGDGLTTDSKVKLNGVIVGKVKSITLGEDNRVMTTISLNKEHRLPSDSRVTLTRDLLGLSAIEIKPGVDIAMFKDGQQIEGQEQEIKFDNEINVENVMGLIGEVLNPNRKTTQDSILLELRRLNRNVEKLLEKK
jgi:ABC-type transporter Mla subunit MlaD